MSHRITITAATGDNSTTSSSETCTDATTTASGDAESDIDIANTDDEEEDEEDDDSIGSLVDFVKDEIEPDTAPSLLSDVNPANIVTGKRKRAAVQRYTDEDFAALMLHGVPASQVAAVFASDTEDEEASPNKVTFVETSEEDDSFNTSDAENEALELDAEEDTEEEEDNEEDEYVDDDEDDGGDL